MTHRTRLGTTALAMALSAAMASSVSAAGRYLGKEFPDFAARDGITGQEFSLSDLRGKVVLVDFWATWCAPCRAELPSVKRAYRKYKDRGFEIVSISLDRDESRFKSFVGKNGMKWYHVMEGGGWRTRLAKKYGVNSIPGMFIIDPDGICISDRARGPALEAAINRGLAKVFASPAGERSRDAERRHDNTLGPAQARRLKGQLTEASDQLQQVTGPLYELGERLDVLADAINRLDAQLPAPDDPGSAKWRLVYVFEQLHQVRNAMFILGVIGDEKAVTLPPDPLEALSQGGNARAFIQAKHWLASAQKALERMRRAYAEVHDQLASISGQLGDVQKGLSRSSAPAQVLESRVGEVYDEALTFADEWHDPWQKRLDAADKIIARLAQPMTALSTVLDSIDQRIAEVRMQVSTAQRETSALREMRDLFDAVCKDLRRTYNQLDRLNIVSEDSAALPANPFDNRRLKDQRVLAETEAQLQVAGDAVEHARQALSAQKREFDTLAEQATAMRCELSERLADGGDLDDLRQRFSDLCREALTLQDRLAGS